MSRNADGFMASTVKACDDLVRKYGSFDEAIARCQDDVEYFTSIGDSQIVTLAQERIACLTLTKDRLAETQR